MTDEKYTQEFQKALNDYIKLGFSQDECSGFMHGFHKGAEAMQKDERIKELEAEKEHRSLDNFTHAEIVQHLEDYY